MDGFKIMEQLERIEKLVRAGKNVLSLEGASQYTGISRSYLYKLTARSEVPFSKNYRQSRSTACEDLSLKQ